MKIGMVGLGKMGANMTERLLKGGHEVVAFTRFASQEPDALQLKMLSALRNQFGGHAVTLESGQQGLETESPTP